MNEPKPYTKYKIVKNEILPETESGIVGGNIEFTNIDETAKVTISGDSIVMFSDNYSIEDLRKKKLSCKFLAHDLKEIDCETYTIKLEGEEPLSLFSNIIDGIIYEKELTVSVNKSMANCNKLLDEHLESLPNTTTHLN